MSYEAKTVDISAIDGVKIDITVRGDEERAEKALMDLKERIGVIAAAYDAETPPSELDDIPNEYVPLMSVAWGRVFEGEEGE